MEGNNNFQMFQNSGYINNRNRKRIFILDVDDIHETNLGTTGEFDIKLYEPLVIDKHSEVYLDNFLTFNCNVASNTDNSVFCLKINEFNVNSNVASSSYTQNNNNDNVMFNSILIPNENRSTSNYHTTVVHKGKKFNYICDINPCTITNITGKITNIIGQPVFHGTGEGRFLYVLQGITPGATNMITYQDNSTGADIPNILENKNFSITTGILPGSANIVFPYSISIAGTDTLIFTSNELLTNFGDNDDLTNNDNNHISVSISNSNIIRLNDGSNTLTIGTGATGTLLIVGGGRFISEFSIVSKE